MADFDLTEENDRALNAYISDDLDIGANICAMRKVTNDPFFTSTCEKLIAHARDVHGVGYAADVSKAVLGLILAGENKYRILYAINDPDPLPTLCIMVTIRRTS